MASTAEMASEAEPIELEESGKLFFLTREEPEVLLEGCGPT